MRADEAAALRERAEAAQRRVDEADIALRLARARAERAEFERDLERQRADALRAAVEELRAGQALAPSPEGLSHDRPRCTQASNIPQHGGEVSANARRAV